MSSLLSEGGELVTRYDLRSRKVQDLYLTIDEKESGLAVRPPRAPQPVALINFKDIQAVYPGKAGFDGPPVLHQDAPANDCCTITYAVDDGVASLDLYVRNSVAADFIEDLTDAMKRGNVHVVWLYTGVEGGAGDDTVERKEFLSVSSKLQTTEDQLAERTAELREKTERAEHLEQQLAQATALLGAGSDGQTADLQAQIHNLEQQMATNAALVKEAGTMSTALAAVREENSQLQQTAQDLKARLLLAEQKAEQAAPAGDGGAAQRAQTQLRMLQVANNNLSAENQTLGKKVGQLERVVAQMKAMSRAAGAAASSSGSQSELSDLRAEVTRLKDAFSDEVTRNKSIREEKAHLLLKLNEAENEVLELRSINGATGDDKAAAEFELKRDLVHTAKSLKDAVEALEQAEDKTWAEKVAPYAESMAGLAAQVPQADQEHKLWSHELRLSIAAEGLPNVNARDIIDPVCIFFTRDASAGETEFQFRAATEYLTNDPNPQFNSPIVLDSVLLSNPQLECKLSVYDVDSKEYAHPDARAGYVLFRPSDLLSESVLAVNGRVRLPLSHPVPLVQHLLNSRQSAITLNPQLVAVEVRDDRSASAVKRRLFAYPPTPAEVGQVPFDKQAPGSDQPVAAQAEYVRSSLRHSMAVLSGVVEPEQDEKDEGKQADTEAVGGTVASHSTTTTSSSSSSSHTVTRTVTGGGGGDSAVQPPSGAGSPLQAAALRELQNSLNETRNQLQAARERNDQLETELARANVRSRVQSGVLNRQIDVLGSGSDKLSRELAELRAARDTCRCKDGSYDSLRQQERTAIRNVAELETEKRLVVVQLRELVADIAQRAKQTPAPPTMHPNALPPLVTEPPGLTSSANLEAVSERVGYIVEVARLQAARCERESAEKRAAVEEMEKFKAQLFVLEGRVRELNQVVKTREDTLRELSKELGAMNDSMLELGQLSSGWQQQTLSEDAAADGSGLAYETVNSPPAMLECSLSHDFLRSLMGARGTSTAGTGGSATPTVVLYVRNEVSGEGRFVETEPAQSAETVSTDSGLIRVTDTFRVSLKGYNADAPQENRQRLEFFVYDGESQDVSDEDRVGQVSVQLSDLVALTAKQQPVAVEEGKQAPSTPPVSTFVPLQLAHEDTRKAELLTRHQARLLLRPRLLYAQDSVGGGSSSGSPGSAAQRFSYYPRATRRVTTTTTTTTTTTDDRKSSRKTLGRDKGASSSVSDSINPANITSRIGELRAMHENLLGELKARDASLAQAHRSRQDMRKQLHAAVQAKQAEEEAKAQSMAAQQKMAEDLQTVQKYAGQLEAQNAALEEELSKGRGRLQAQVARLTEEATHRGNELASLRADHAALETRQEALRAQIQTLQEVRDSLKRQLEEANEDREQLEARADRLHQQLRDLERTRVEMEGTSMSLNEAIRAKEARQAALETALQQAQKEAAEQAAALKAAEALANDLRSREEQAQVKAQDLETRVWLLSEKVRGLESSVEANKRRGDAAVESEGGLEKRLKIQAQRISEIEQENGQLRAKLVDAEQVASKAQFQEKYQEALVTQLETRVQALTEELEQAEKKTGGTQDEVAQLRRKNGVIQQYLMAHTSRVHEAEKEIADLQEQLERARAVAARAEQSAVSQSTGVEARVAAAQSERDAAQRISEELRRQLSQWESTSGEMETRVRNEQAKVQRLEEQLGQLEQLNSQMRAEGQAAGGASQQQVDELQSKIRAMEAQANADRQRARGQVASAESLLAEARASERAANRRLAELQASSSTSDASLREALAARDAAVNSASRLRADQQVLKAQLEAAEAEHTRVQQDLLARLNAALAQNAMLSAQGSPVVESAGDSAGSGGASLLNPAAWASGLAESAGVAPPSTVGSSSSSSSSGGGGVSAEPGAPVVSEEESSHHHHHTTTTTTTTTTTSSDPQAEVEQEVLQMLANQEIGFVNTLDSSTQHGVEQYDQA